MPTTQPWSRRRGTGSYDWCELSPSSSAHHRLQTHAMCWLQTPGIHAARLAKECRKGSLRLRGCDDNFTCRVCSHPLTAWRGLSGGCISLSLPRTLRQVQQLSCTMHGCHNLDKWCRHTSRRMQHAAPCSQSHGQAWSCRQLHASKMEAPGLLRLPLIRTAMRCRAGAPGACRGAFPEDSSADG